MNEEWRPAVVLLNLKARIQGIYTFLSATVNSPKAENPRFLPSLGVVGSLSSTCVEYGKVCGNSETIVSERVTCRVKISGSFCYGHYVIFVTEMFFYANTTRT